MKASYKTKLNCKLVRVINVFISFLVGIICFDSLNINISSLFGRFARKAWAYINKHLAANARPKIQSLINHIQLKGTKKRRRLTMTRKTVLTIDGTAFKQIFIYFTQHVHYLPHYRGLTHIHMHIRSTPNKKSKTKVSLHPF